MPQFATLVKEPPSGPEWLHELKFDGYRMPGRMGRGTVKLWSRNGLDWTNKFQNVVNAIKGIKETAIFDGEVLIFDSQGRSSFQKLLCAMGRKTVSGFTYQVFDLLYLNGRDIRVTALIDRKALLQSVLRPGSDPALRFSEHVRGRGNQFFKHACEFGVEGIVSKIASSPYESARTKKWLKVKCNKQQEFVIAGYTRTSSANLPGLGSLVLAVYDGQKLKYARSRRHRFHIQATRRVEGKDGQACAA